MNHIRIINHFTKTAILLLILSFCSCFSYGLPEPISGFALKKPERIALSYRPQTTVLISETNPLNPKRESLGSQYLLGLIPLTSLYFEHGNKLLLKEIALDVLSTSNTRVIISDFEDLNNITRSVPINRIYNVSLSNFRLNAWDLFLFRRISAQGNVVVHILEPRVGDNNSSEDFYLKEQSNQEIDNVSYKSQAQGASLAAFAQNSVKQALEKALLKINSSENKRLFNKLANSHFTSQQSKKYIYIEAPNVKNIPQYFGRDVADSYGFSNWPSYNQTQVARILQRGLSNGSSSENLKSYEVHGASGKLLADNSNSNLNSLVFSSKLISTHINKNNDSLSLSLSWLLKKDDVPDRRAKLQGKCDVEVIVKSKVDGAWVLALEKAGEEIAREIFENKASREALKKKYQVNQDIISKNINCRIT